MGMARAAEMVGPARSTLTLVLARSLLTCTVLVFLWTMFLMSRRSFWFSASADSYSWRMSEGRRERWAIRSSWPDLNLSTLSSLVSSAAEGGFFTLPVSMVERYGFEKPTRPLTSSRVAFISYRRSLKIWPNDIAHPHIKKGCLFAMLVILPYILLFVKGLFA